MIPVAVRYHHPDNEHATVYTVNMSVEAVGWILLPVMDALDGIDNPESIQQASVAVTTAIMGAWR
jgi:hypothetical protein